MSKIKFEQISEDLIEVVLPPETPMEMVEQIQKSFTTRGLIEDLSKSTVSVRYFYRPQDEVNYLADKLIKSLSELAKDDYDYSPKAKKLHLRGQAVRNAVAAQRPPAAPKVSMPKAPAAPNVAPTPGKMYDSNPAAQVTAGGSGKRYGYITNKAEKDEDEDDVEKSNYGPKGAKQYSAVDNARRKANNVGAVEGIGPNTNVKSYSTKPGQMSAKASADLTARIQAKANKKQPVKRWSAEEIEIENKKRGLKKAWGQHLPFPSAEEEIMRLAKNDKTQLGENALANQLANVLHGKAMLGTPPPSQPTDEQMFGHLVVTEEMAKTNEQKWNGAAFNWLAEAAKPLKKNFASEEEELAYWNSIKVNDRDDSKSGY